MAKKSICLASLKSQVLLIIRDWWLWFWKIKLTFCRIELYSKYSNIKARKKIKNLEKIKQRKKNLKRFDNKKQKQSGIKQPDSREINNIISLTKKWNIKSRFLFKKSG